MNNKYKNLLYDFNNRGDIKKPFQKLRERQKTEMRNET